MTNTYKSYDTKIISITCYMKDEGFSKIWSKTKIKKKGLHENFIIEIPFTSAKENRR